MLKFLMGRLLTNNIAGVHNNKVQTDSEYIDADLFVISACNQRQATHCIVPR